MQPSIKDLWESRQSKRKLKSFCFSPATKLFSCGQGGRLEFWFSFRWL